MKTSDYRPLPDRVNQCCSLTPVGGTPRPEPTPEMKARMEREESKKEERRKYAALFGEGTASCGEITLPYRLFVPQKLEPGKQYPLVLFLHGGGERGSDNISQVIASDGAVVWVRDQLEDAGEACFVLAPQSPAGEMGWQEKHLLAVSAAMEEITAQYPVDENRIYLTGMSQGGGGCWRMNYMFPTRFAAVVPMCAAACVKNRTEVDQEAVGQVAEAFLDKPLWMFHAADDFVVTPETSRSLVRALEARGKICGQGFFYTEYPAECGYNHGCWEPAFQWKLMRQWMFQQTTAPVPAFGPPEGAQPPFPMEDMAEMMRRDAEAKKGPERMAAPIHVQQKRFP